MHKMKNRILVLWLICISVLSASAGDRETFVNDINAFYKLIATQKVDMDINYKLYNKKVEGMPMQTSAMKIKLDKNNKFIDNSYYTLYSNKKYTLVLYKRNKVAMLSKTNKTTEQLSNILPDSLMLAYLKTVKIVSDTLGLRTYQIKFNEAYEYQQWIMVYNTSNNTIQKSTMYYKSSLVKKFENQGLINEKDAATLPVMVVEYHINPYSVTPEFFEANNILQKKEKHYVLLKPYNSYRLLDQLTERKKQKN